MRGVKRLTTNKRMLKGKKSPNRKVYRTKNLIRRGLEFEERSQRVCLWKSKRRDCERTSQTCERMFSGKSQGGKWNENDGLLLLSGRKKTSDGKFCQNGALKNVAMLWIKFSDNILWMCLYCWISSPDATGRRF